MSFSENLQFYRQQGGLTQEQLAETLGVSRQSVSKWESGQSYPEMEKLLALCELFRCDLDTLLKGSAIVASADVGRAYDAYKNRSAAMSAVGVGILIVGLALACLLDGLGMHEMVAGLAFLGTALVGCMVLIVSGLLSSEFNRKHPRMEDCYSEAQRDAFHSRYVVLTASSLGILFLSLLWLLGCQALPLPTFWRDGLSGSIFFMGVALGVSLLIWTGIQKEKYNIEEYNLENDPDDETRARRGRIGSICACIMMAATAAFVVCIFALPQRLGEAAAILYSVGGIGCGVAAVALNRAGKGEKK